MRENEKKVLAIIALVLGIVALLGSWVPLLNNVSFIIAVPALILAIIALVINRKRHKTLSIVSLVLSILAMAIVLFTQSMYSNALDNASKAIDKTSKSFESSVASSQNEVDKKFKWTKADFDALSVGDTISGVGGANYDDVVSKFGEPTSSSESTSGDYTSKYVDYDTVGGSEYKSVSLQFVKQADNTWLLSYKSSSGLE